MVNSSSCCACTHFAYFVAASLGIGCSFFQTQKIWNPAQQQFFSAKRTTCIVPSRNIETLFYLFFFFFYICISYMLDCTCVKHNCVPLLFLFVLFDIFVFFFLFFCSLLCAARCTICFSLFVAKHFIEYSNFGLNCSSFYTKYLTNKTTTTPHKSRACTNKQTKRLA